MVFRHVCKEIKVEHCISNITINVLKCPENVLFFALSLRPRDRGDKGHCQLSREGAVARFGTVWHGFWGACHRATLATRGRRTGRQRGLVLACFGWFWRVFWVCHLSFVIGHLSFVSGRRVTEEGQ